jgi:hypothetical protein
MRFEKFISAKKVIGNGGLGSESEQIRCNPIDLADVRERRNTPEETLDYIDKRIVKELDETYPSIVDCETDGIADALALINDKTRAKFVIIIDEWDCLTGNGIKVAL